MPAGIFEREMLAAQLASWQHSMGLVPALGPSADGLGHGGGGSGLSREGTATMSTGVGATDDQPIVPPLEWLRAGPNGCNAPPEGYDVAKKLSPTVRETADLFAQGKDFVAIGALKRRKAGAATVQEHLHDALKCGYRPLSADPDAVRRLARVFFPNRAELRLIAQGFRESGSDIGGAMNFNAVAVACGKDKAFLYKVKWFVLLKKLKFPAMADIP